MAKVDVVAPKAARRRCANSAASLQPASPGVDDLRGKGDAQRFTSDVIDAARAIADPPVAIGNGGAA